MQINDLSPNICDEFSVQKTVKQIKNILQQIHIPKVAISCYYKEILQKIHHTLWWSLYFTTVYRSCQKTHLTANLWSTPDVRLRSKCYLPPNTGKCTPPQPKARRPILGEWTKKAQLTQGERATVAHVWKPSKSKSVARGCQTTGG